MPIPAICNNAVDFVIRQGKNFKYSLRNIQGINPFNLGCRCVTGIGITVLSTLAAPAFHLSKGEGALIGAVFAVYGISLEILTRIQPVMSSVAIVITSVGFIASFCWGSEKTCNVAKLAFASFGLGIGCSFFISKV